MVWWLHKLFMAGIGLFVILFLGLWLETTFLMAGTVAFAWVTFNRLIQSPSVIRLIYLFPLVPAVIVSKWGIDLSLHSNEMGILYVHGLIAYIKHSVSLLFSLDGILFHLATGVIAGGMALIVFGKDPVSNRQRTE